MVVKCFRGHSTGQGWGGGAFQLAWGRGGLGNLQRSTAPSKLVLTMYLPLGHILALVMEPLWPTPTCVTSPSVYFHTFTSFSSPPAETQGHARTRTEEHHSPYLCCQNVS
ncbi:hypothetical protein JZ751_013263 [Albula glossodonta]|uniref:Uncharacterized protein n=1 Tax=Albula glossodonta TaxID=121402 RepID=A0A8T2P5D9_9TELE|nr:hypothetical protein JZ751_013263 [Albula glossodonta]